jgi:hypothetical protein
MTDLSQTVRVAADGTVTRGVVVDLRASNRRSPDDFRILAASPMHAKPSHYRGEAGVPRDVSVPDGRGGYRRTRILAVTFPHDCANHANEVFE